MKKIILVFLFVPFFLTAQNTFQRYFADSTLRIDYYHIGDSDEEIITLDQFYLQPVWAGAEKKLIDPFDNGNYYIKIFDQSGKTLLYSKGFNSYFGEYRATSQAKKGIKRTFHETALIPFTREPVLFKFYSRDKENNLQPVFEQTIDPASLSINSENRAAGAKTYSLHKSGDAHKCVDIAILAEGYTLEDSLKLKKDFRRYTNILLNKPPFSEFKNKINIYGVFKPSQEQNCDEPTRDIYRNTTLNCTFNSMGSPRYLLTEDNRTLHDLASAVPYDALIIMVNQDRYGGGGIYNFFMVFTTDNVLSENVFIHEFGHSFAGLADEYYSSGNAYDEFYPPGTEPTEPNITRLFNPPEVKWQELVENSVPVPTPWRKEEFDRIQTDYLKKRREFNEEIARLSRAGAPSEKIAAKKKEADALSVKIEKTLDKLIQTEKYSGKVGAFEGAGYVSKGMYRPMLDCVMFRNGDRPFCKVCARRIEEVIRQLCDD